MIVEVDYGYWSVLIERQINRMERLLAYCDVAIVCRLLLDSHHNMHTHPYGMSWCFKEGNEHRAFNSNHCRLHPQDFPLVV